VRECALCQQFVEEEEGQWGNIKLRRVVAVWCAEAELACCSRGDDGGPCCVPTGLPFRRVMARRSQGDDDDRRRVSLTERGHWQSGILRASSRLFAPFSLYPAPAGASWDGILGRVEML
jgi:hypothetical protein